MTLQDIIQLIQDDWGKWTLIIFLVSGFIEVSPIKVNPWKYILNVIYTKLFSHSDNLVKEVNENISIMCDSMKSLDDRISNVENNISNVQESISNIKSQTDTLSEVLNDHIIESKQERIDNMRTTILDFANSCMNKRRHTEEEFEYMIHLCDEYESYCEKNKIKNGVAIVAIREIRRIYQENRYKGTLLKEGEG